MQLLKENKNKETWGYKDPIYGDQIRTFRNPIYHHGIFVSVDEVIHFGDGTFSSDSCNYVQKTSLKEFLRGGILEVRTYSKKEKKQRNEVDLVVKKAREKIGMTGYDIIHHNCEHFSNECAFNRAYSHQVEAIREKIGAIIK